MTRTEERLGDALAASARALREDTLRPLAVPQRRKPGRPWLAPVAAAAAVTLVAGLRATVGGLLPGSGGGPSAAVAAPYRYYVQADLDGHLLVRSTATGAVSDRIAYRVPTGYPGGYPIVASAGHGTFFVAAYERGPGERIYRFRLTGAGRISGFTQVPGTVLGTLRQVDALAASPDGSQLAIGVTSLRPADVSQVATGGTSLGPADVYTPNGPVAPLPDEILVINSATGAQRVWRAGMRRLGNAFSVADLSWTGDGRELVAFGAWCHIPEDAAQDCLEARNGPAEVLALDPGSGGGRLDSGHLLLRQSARYPDIVQAVISLDGSTITALVLTGPYVGSHDVSGGLPDNLSLEQVSVATGRLVGVLYRRHMGPTSGEVGAPDPLALVRDGAGRHWILEGGISGGSGYDNGFNGWIDHGRLIPLQPADGYEASETW
jgi:hypothetical protein